MRRTCGVPRTEDDAAVCGVVLDLADALLELVDALARVVCVTVFILGTKVPPLKAVYGAEVTFATVTQSAFLKELLGAIAVPDLDAGGGEGRGGGAAGEEPEEFGGDGAEEDAFGG